MKRPHSIASNSRLVGDWNNKYPVGTSVEVKLDVNYKGYDMAITFNPQYVLEACLAFKGGEMWFEMTNELTPGVWREGQTVVVVMPMRLS